jgi:TolA-binding protein
MPKRFKESSLGSTILSIVSGLVIGAAVTAWLFIPQVKKQAQTDANQQILAANDTISTNNQTIAALQEQVDQLQAQIDSVEDNSEEVQSEIDAYEKILSACNLYLSGDLTGTGAALAEIEKDSLSSSAQQTYQTLSDLVDTSYIETRYQEGTALYNANDYENAVVALQEVADADIDYDSGNCAYYLAQSYRKVGETDLAIPYYQYIIDNYPNTKRAKTAKNYVK